MNNLPQTRACTKCGVEKLPDEFHKDKKGPGGLSHRCKECAIAHAKAHYHENRDRLLANRAGYAKQYREQNRDRLREELSKWRSDNPIAYRNQKFRVRSPLGPEVGKFTQDEWDTLCARHGNVCAKCGDAGPLTVDHIIPLSKNGLNTIENIQPLCATCNKSKWVYEHDYRA